MHEKFAERWNAVSLRTKITGVTVLLLTLGLLVSGIGTMAMLKPYLIGQVDNQLRSSEASLSTAARADSMGGGGSTDAVSGNDQLYVAILDSDGRLLRDNWSANPNVSAPTVQNLNIVNVLSRSDQIFSVTDAAHNTTFRATVIPFQFPDAEGKIDTGTLFMALSTANVENAMATYLGIFLTFGVVVVLVGAILTRMLVTTTFGPLREVENTAAAIADGDFSQRLSDVTPNTEVGRLNRSLNTMLSRIDRAFDDRARTIEQMRRFVGDASHELRTPLVSVRGYAELYRMGALQSPDEVAQAMQRIEKEAIRMGALVEDLLELARLDETKPLELAEVDLVPIARDAALDAMASQPERRVTVVTPPPILAHVVVPEVAAIPSPDETAAGVQPLAAGATGPIAFAGATIARLRGRRPRRGDSDIDEIVMTDSQALALPRQVEVAPAEPAIVVVEENKIRQVITNLMGNAMRFTDRDSPIEIVVQADYRSQLAVVSVADHGDGIPPQIREKIFQRFWRADTSRTRETGGSGLGLAIVSSIVAAHHGSVDVVETPGGGATFRVFLPLAPR